MVVKTNISGKPKGVRILQTERKQPKMSKTKEHLQGFNNPGKAYGGMMLTDDRYKGVSLGEGSTAEYLKVSPGCSKKGE